MKKIMTLGEVLIDLTQMGTAENGVPEFRAFPGGAPANVAVAASRLGAETGFIGKVGSDRFGAYLRETLEENRVDTSYLFESDRVPTTLAVVSVDERGERSFSFYRDPGADTQLTSEEAAGFLDAEAGYSILHFGSLSLTTEPSREAALQTVSRAREQGLLISYDPNYRPALWNDTDEAVRWMKAPLDMVDILKISDEELVLMTGTDDPEAGSAILADHGIRLVLITLGSKGVTYRYSGRDGVAAGTIPGETVKVADTNGAGDTFLGAVLSKIEPSRFDELGGEELRQIIVFANHAAAVTCSRPGAIPAMPTIEEL